MAAKAKKSNFLADVWYELTTKVVWPTWKRLRVATIVVVGFIIVWALLLYGFDSAFTWFQGQLVDDAVVQKEWARIQETNAPATEDTTDTESGLPGDFEIPEDMTIPETNQ
ncbi:MAG: preprotein translocase subunit SecE [Caldisericia bacterium]